MIFPHSKIFRSAVVARFTSLTVLVFLLSSVSVAQRVSRAEAPFDGKAPGSKVEAADQLTTAQGPWRINTNGITCKDLDDSSEPQYAHMTTAWEMRLDFSTPNGTFPVQNGGGVVLDGGMDPNPNIAITISSTANNVNSWSLGPIPLLDRVVSAIIVKGGPALNVYTYPNLSIGDIGPFTTPQRPNGTFPAVSHVIFCMEPFAGPSSAPVTISGRTLTSAGAGVGGSRIELMSLSTGEVISTITNPFGYYTFSNISSEETYVVTASHKRVQFINPQRTITVNEDILGIDFVTP